MHLNHCPTPEQERFCYRLSATLALTVQFSLHSLRSGGATAASNNNVPDRLLKVHGRWASDKAKDGYIDDSIQKKLLV